MKMVRKILSCFIVLVALTIHVSSWETTRAYEKASSYSNQFQGTSTNHQFNYQKQEKKLPASYFKKLFKNYNFGPTSVEKKASSYINNEIHFDNEISNSQQQEKIFSYDENDEYGPSKWYKINEQCNGNYQSPIAIDVFNTTEIKFSPALSFEGIGIKPTSLTVENNGHSMKIKFNLPNNQKVRISGGPLSDSYILDNAHWHWGRIDKSGSEHIIKGRRFSAELHLVFYNSIYGTFEAAASEAKGLAVLGILYNVDPRKNGYINPWAPLIHRVLNSKSTYTETQNTFTIRDLIRSEQFKYFSYKGSLTTPNCTENVTWMISSRPISISSAELREFRKMRNEKGEQMFFNFRPLQFSKNDRNVAIYAQ